MAHMKLNVPASVVHMLYVAADGWRKVKAQEPQKLGRPMRTSLFVCFWAELKTRIQALEGSPGDVDKLAELGWLVKGPPLTWHFLKWDAAAQRSVIDTNKPPLTNAEILVPASASLSAAFESLAVPRHRPRNHYPSSSLASPSSGDHLRHFPIGPAFCWIGPHRLQSCQGFLGSLCRDHPFQVWPFWPLSPQPSQLLRLPREAPMPTESQLGGTADRSSIPLSLRWTSLARRNPLPRKTTMGHCKKEGS